MPPSLFFGVISSRLHPQNPCFSLKSEHDKRSEKVPKKCLSNSPKSKQKSRPESVVDSERETK